MSSLSYCCLRVSQHRAAPEELPVAERERAARFFREEDRQRYLLGRTALRRLCARKLMVTPQDVPLQEGPHGKPHLPGGEDGAGWQFNLAHSGDAVALVWGESGPAGVDIERLDRPHVHSFAELGRTAFSRDEQAALATAAAPEAAQVFYGIWVRKEAVVKAEGCGLTGGLQHFSVAVPGQRGALHWPAVVNFPGTLAAWHLSEVPAPAGYLAAVASLQAEPPALVPPAALGW